jgi:hypothetical protein
MVLVKCGRSARTGTIQTASICLLQQSERVGAFLIEHAVDDPCCRLVVQADDVTGDLNVDWKPD